MVKESEGRLGSWEDRNRATATEGFDMVEHVVLPDDSCLDGPDSELEIPRFV